MKKKKIFSYKLIIHLIFILLCLGFIIPFLYMVSLSFTPESGILCTVRSQRRDGCGGAVSRF